MKTVWLRTALLAAALGVAALIVGLSLGRVWALGTLATGLAVLLVHHVANLGALAAWLRDPLHADVPMGTGQWEGVFTALYRFVRGTRQHQHRLTAQLVRFRSAAQAMPDAVIVLDGEDHISWCNTTAERYFGLDAQKDIGQPILNLVRQPDFGEYMKRGEYAEPFVLRLARGEALVLSVRIVAYGQDEKLLLSRDVTQAEKLETMRRDFVANVSHELKTPLTVVSGFLETIADGNVKLEEPRGQQVLGLMRNQSDRMLRLIDDLLTLSALESTTMPARETAIDVQALLRTVHEEARALSGGRHAIVLEPGPAATLWGDEREVRSAIVNLVSNAVRYTPKDGRIVLAWSERDGEGWMSVEDSGIGIETRHIPRITERFYRVDTSRSRETGGTGLGLAIVKHVLTHHQARLEVASEPGKGSRFAAVFPARRVKWLAAQTVA
ncbi:MAG TPA: phosphate regulon sensor histidine kinase PhoR [Burkholderiales bacterium]|nr:phosphate regulon sensor histidine kinase PhoR [Burkholderiales bacterium]